MKFLKKLFAAPTDDKVTEKCMSRVLICAVCSILLCTVCLASTTWAWYETQIISDNNRIVGGSWDVPGEPSGHSELTEPSETTGPTEITEPSEATEPTEITEPSEATEPAEITEPSEVTEPTEITEPAEATEPSEAAVDETL